MKFSLDKIALVLIIVLAALLRFWHLSQYPPSLNVDEVSNGYNAYSILETARDEYGNFMPLTFRSFGDYNLAFSVYTLVPSISVFGLNALGVRFPSALLGTLTVFLTYLLVLKISKDRQTSLIASFLLAISPWHLQFSRYDHEANFMVFFSILGLVLLLYSNRKLSILVLSALSFAISLNTYQGAKIWVPLFAFLVVIFFRKILLGFRAKVAPFFLILAFSTLPIVLNFQSSLIRGQSVGILSEKNPLKTFISGYLSHFSPNFLFINGDYIGRHSVPGMGELYVFEIPLIILGLAFLIKNSNQEFKFLLAWLALAPIPAALATPTPHALRAITFLPLWSTVAAFGFQELRGKLQNTQKIAILSLLFAVATYNVITYFHLYYKHYPKIKALDWADGYKETIEYVGSIQDQYSQIAVSSFYGHPYIYTLFYLKYDPAKYQTYSGNKNSFDKYEFFGASWKKTKPGKALVVTPYWQAHPPKVLKNIYLINGDLAFTISEEE